MDTIALPTLSGVEHAYVDLPGLRMHVAQAGKGEPVLLLHGFPQHWWEWRGIIPRLAPHYRVICPDLRGALLGHGHQPLARYLLETDVAEHAFSAEDREAFLAPLRQPERARAGSALYRRLILPEMRRIATRAYRDSRLTVPSRVLYGPADPAVVPEMHGGYEAYADDLAVEPIEGAAHFLADERPDPVADRILAFFATP